MEAHVNSGSLISDLSRPPLVVEQLVAQLQTDCGADAQIEVVNKGTTHGGTQRRFSIGLRSKKQKLTSLCRATFVDVVDVLSKRSGTFVVTRIDVKVDESLMLTPLSK